MTLLSVNDLYLHYITENGIVVAVDGVSFDITQGEALGIVGESGSGKTSMSLALMRLIPRNAIIIDNSCHLHQTKKLIKKIILKKLYN